MGEAMYETIISGPENCVLLVTLASREKEGSNEDPIADEIELRAKLKQVGFTSSRRWCQVLQVPSEECPGFVLEDAV